MCDAPVFDDDAASFEHATRLAEYLSRAELLVPAHLRGKPADLLLVLHMARASGHDPVHILQSTYVIGGKVGFSAQYIIALINGSGRIRGPVRWREEGEGKSLAVTAYATLAETGDEISATVTMAMAEADGWTRRNPKYQSMGSLMLRYRSATLLGRMYFPDVLLGFHERDELIDADRVEAVYTDPEPASPPPRVSRAAAPFRGGEPAASAGSSGPAPGPEVVSDTSPPSGPPLGPGVSDLSWTPEVEARFQEQLLKLDPAFTLDAVSAFCEDAGVPVPRCRDEIRRRSLLDALRGPKREAARAFCANLASGEPTQPEGAQP